MIELPLVLMAGVLGSSHCLGMCGGFALTVGSSATSLQNNAVRQAIYTAGRLFTYATLGAIAGYSGSRLEQLSSLLVSIPAMLSIAAGSLLVYQGMLAAGLLKKRSLVGKNGCLAGSFFASFLTGPQLLQVFLAGIFTGLLPCGLLYGMVALAASTRSMGHAMLLMIAFGFGTTPLMVATGLGGGFLTLKSRRHLFRIAAWCLIATGAISVVRGAGFLFIPSGTTPPTCPFCAK